MSMTATKTGGNFLGVRDYDESIATFYLAGMQLSCSSIMLCEGIE